MQFDIQPLYRTKEYRVLYKMAFFVFEKSKNNCMMSETMLKIGLVIMMNRF